MSATIRVLFARTGLAHVSDPDRFDYFLCRAGERYGAPVLNFAREVTREEFRRFGLVCSNCKRALRRRPMSAPEVEPMPFRARDARTAAYTAMSTTASRMSPDGRRLRFTDPVAYADLVTTMNDHRAALCLARGVALEHLDRDGFDVSTPTARAYVEAKRAELETRRFPAVVLGSRAREQARHATGVMVDAVEAMRWATHQSHDMVAWADARTSADDARAALALANGAGVQELDRSGFRRA